MSTIIMAACWPLQGMSTAQKAVLISLADQANDEGVCWPAIETLATRTCMAPRSVQRVLTWLQEVGLVTREYRHNRSTVYTVTPARYVAEIGVESEADPDAWGDTPSPPGVTQCHQGGDTPSPRGDTPSPPGVTQCHPNHQYNHQRTVNGIDKGAKSVPRCPDDVNPETWSDWLQLRREKKAVVTQTAVDRIRSEAGRAGMSLDAALAECCLRGWRGFKAEWVKPAAGRDQGLTFAQRDELDRRRRWEEMTGQSWPSDDADHGNVIEVGGTLVAEATHGRAH